MSRIKVHLYHTTTKNVKELDFILKKIYYSKVYYTEFGNNEYSVIANVISCTDRFFPQSENLCLPNVVIYD